MSALGLAWMVLVFPIAALCALYLYLEHADNTPMFWPLLSSAGAQRPVGFG